MAVVDTLSVILQALTGQYSEGMKKAAKDTKALEKQVTSTQRVVRGFNATLKGIGTIGGKVGLGGAFGGLVGGFTFANFAKDSLKEHAKDNKELQATLGELDQSFIQIKKNFGAWLTEVAGAGSIINTFNSQLKGLSGENINIGQAAVNAGNQPLGRLDTQQTATELRRNITQAVAAQQSVLAQLEASRGFGLTNGSFDFNKADPVFQRQFETLNAEINLMRKRLIELQQAGKDVTGQLPNIGKFFDTQISRGLNAGVDLFEKFGDLGGAALEKIGGGLRAIDSGLEKATTKAHDMMSAFKVTEGQMSPLEIFKKDTEELQRLFDTGFLKDDAFNLALLDAQKKLEDFVGPIPELPSRASGARRGSAEAFEKVAAFQDRGQTPEQRTLQELLEETKELVRIERENAKRVREQFDDLETIDTKP